VWNTIFNYDFHFFGFEWYARNEATNIKKKKKNRSPATTIRLKEQVSFKEHGSNPEQGR
jgi:hypothetical protein